MDVTRERCKKIIEAGANVILCSRGIDDFALKYFVENNAYAIRRVKKSDLRRIANCSGAKIVVSLADFDGEEKFDQIISRLEDPGFLLHTYQRVIPNFLADAVAAQQDAPQVV